MNYWIWVTGSSNHLFWNLPRSFQKTTYDTTTQFKSDCCILNIFWKDPEVTSWTIKYVTAHFKFLCYIFLQSGLGSPLIKSSPDCAQPTSSSFIHKIHSAAFNTSVLRMWQARLFYWCLQAGIGLFFQFFFTMMGSVRLWYMSLQAALGTVFLLVSF